MKKFLLCATLSLMALNGFAQDVIVKSDQDIIVAKILEVSNDLVSYKDFNNQDGPTFSIMRSTVSKIKFANGMEMNFSDDTGNINNLSQMTGTSISNENEDLVARAAECTSQAQFYARFREEQLKTIFSADEYALYRKGKRQDVAGSVLTGIGSGHIGLGAVLILTSACISNNGGAPGGICSLLGFSSLGLGIALDIPGLILYFNNNSSLAYNKFKQRTSQQSSNMTINIGAQRNGIGLALNF